MSPGHRRWIYGCITAAIWLSACSKPEPVFDGDRAFADLVRQTEFSPRVPGTVGHDRCGEWLRVQLGVLADSLIEQSFKGKPFGYSDSISMVNYVGRFGTRASRRILLCAHWDTRPFADMDPDSANRTQSLPGANDGASGVAVLLEVARALRAQAPSIGVDLAFFDGEDAGRYGDEAGWCLGSRHFAAHMSAKYQWAILVDMVGERDLQLLKEGYSLRYAAPLVEKVWKAAAAMGETAFLPGREEEIFDDHMPLLARGLQAIDIIDIRYPYWHTSQDAPDKCAPASLATVGRVLLRVVYSE
jgi:hypothetical protein